ncbi:MAG TPA: alpha/beta hydrolase [Vicinamibacterales bacterium]|nr:alpha/beta hydrolase [Vicinamibacterales bacterium]
MIRRILSACALALLCSGALAQLSQSALFAVEFETHYNYAPNTSYVSENGVELKLDLFTRRDVTTPQPTLIFFHGGFWVAGSKDSQVLALMPWLEKGWNVINVGYRLGGVAPAPAAVVDAFCALRWAGTNAAMYNIDTTRIVASGQSAGGHLALTLGLLDEAGFDAACPAGETPRVAAVINWFGVTDVADVIAGPNRNETPLRWFGTMPEAEAVALATRLSPMQYTRDGLPPILTIQGDADMVVPYRHGVMLHEALQKTDTKNLLLTIPGGGHGRFTAGERAMIYEVINGFLQQQGLE